MRQVLISVKSYTRTRFDLPVDEVVDVDALVGIVALLLFLVGCSTPAIMGKMGNCRMTLLGSQARVGMDWECDSQ